MTDGEKIIWGMAYTAAFNEYCPSRVRASAKRWAEDEDAVQDAVVLAVERATLTVMALRKIKTQALKEQCCEEAEDMVVSMLECD